MRVLIVGVLRIMQPARSILSVYGTNGAHVRIKRHAGSNQQRWIVNLFQIQEDVYGMTLISSVMKRAAGNISIRQVVKVRVVVGMEPVVLKKVAGNIMMRMLV